jgi:hypothetical protein
MVTDAAVTPDQSEQRHRPVRVVEVVGVDRWPAVTGRNQPLECLGDLEIRG